MKANKEILQVLSPYGQWEHHKGMQIVDEESAMKMKKSAKQSFSSTIPIYIGHPDESKSRKKHKVVGKIKKIFQSKDCIVVQALYPEDIYNKILDGTYKSMSPRWKMQQIDEQTYRPIKLISVGLTNNPNIPNSGDILSSIQQIDKPKLKTIPENKILARLSHINKNLKDCRKQTSNLKESFDSLKIDIRISNQKNADANYQNMKISIKDLPYLALERSKALGESYTQSFATLKKQVI